MYDLVGLRLLKTNVDDDREKFWLSLWLRLLIRPGPEWFYAIDATGGKSGYVFGKYSPDA